MVTKAQPNASLSEQVINIRADLIFDPASKQFLTGDRDIVVNKSIGQIVGVRPASYAKPDIDLRGKTVLPGLVDAHTHIFLHAYSETPSLNQMRDESHVERILRATNHAKAALMAGYTTYRDLGTEGLGEADVHFRDAINRGIIPGPRMFCATEALASSGGYEIRVESDVSVPRISDPCDGVVGVKAAVRRRLGAGADVIKFYADYRKRALRWPESSWPGCPDIQFPPYNHPLGSIRNPNLPLFDQEEMDAIVSQAKFAKAPIAAHASSAQAVTMAANAGVTSVEHGFEADAAAISTMADCGTIFVPTLSVIELYLPMEPILKMVKKAHDQGVKLACGGDTGAFSHGQNVREIELMLEAGIPLEEVLVAATTRGWEACGGEQCGMRFGWWDTECAADVVALDGDIRKDSSCLRKIEFVMKDGKVWKEKGSPVSAL